MTAPAGGPFCRQCGEPATGGQFCARCGTPLPITPPAAGPKSGMRGVLAIVCVSLIVLGVATFFGVRWWIAPSAQDGNAIAGDVESSLAGNGSDESGGAVPSDHRSSKAPGTPTSSSVVESDGASTVVVTSVSVAPPVQTTVTVQSTVTATPSADAAVGAPRLDVTCDHSYIVVLASSLSASDFSAMLPRLQAYYGNTKYLYTGGSCFNFGEKNAYALYDGPYATLADACKVRFAGTNDGYVKVADPTVTDRTIGCLCPLTASNLVQLSSTATGEGYRGPYVGEAQYALHRLGYYDEDNAGEFTPETEQAVKSFQAAKGLPADGVVNAATWLALITADCSG